MRNQVLSIEQMQELKELGIDISKASIYWIIQVSNARGKKKDLIPPFLSLHNYTQKVGMEHFESIPTFTLQDILELLPEFLPPKLDVMDYNYELAIRKDSIYYDCEVFDYSPKGDLVRFDGDNMLNNSFNMLKWCKQNNYI